MDRVKTDYGLVYETEAGQVLLKSFDEPSCHALVDKLVELGINPPSLVAPQEEWLLGMASVAIDRGYGLDDETVLRVKRAFRENPALVRCYPFVAAFLGEPFKRQLAGILRWSMSPQGCRGAMNEHPFHLDETFRLVWDDCPPGTVFTWHGDDCRAVGKWWAVEKEALRLIAKTLLPELERYIGSPARTARVLDYCRLLGRDMSGVMIGRQSKTMEPEYDVSNMHLLTVGTTGSGKFTANIAPACLQYRGSLFVIDPDGEAAAVTARARFERHGQTPYIFDPFGILRRKLGGGFPKHAVEIAYNPLRDLDINSVAFDADARQLASSILVSKSEKDPIWKLAADELLTGLIMLVRTDESETARDLPTVRKYLGATRKEMLDFVVPKLMASPIPSLQELARTIEETPRDTFEGFRLQCKADMGFLNDRTIATALADRGENQFSFDNLFGNEFMPGVTEDDIKDINARLGGWPYKRAFNELQMCGGCSLYMVMPLEYSESHSGLLRLVANLFLKKAMRSQRFGPPTLFIFDETANAGQLEMLPMACTALRKHNVRVWTFWQTLKDIEDIYPKRTDSIRGNAIHLLMGTTAQATADAYSTRVGVEVKFELQSIAKGESGGTATTRGTSIFSSDAYGTNSSYSSGWSGNQSNWSTSKGSNQQRSSGSGSQDSIAINAGWQQTETIGRFVEPIIRPQQLLEEYGGNSRKCLVFPQGAKPIPLEKVNYFDEDMWETMGRFADDNPWRKPI